MRATASRVRGAIKRRANLLFLGVLLPAAALSIRYHAVSVMEHRRYVAERVEAEAQVRHARMLSAPEERRQLLLFAATWFGTVPALAHAHLRQLTDEHLAGPGLTEMCWTASDGGTQLSSAASSGLGTSHCRQFDLLEPSRILGTPPRMILSRFAPTVDGRAGFASIIFDVRSLLLERAQADFSEYLVVHDMTQNMARTYAVKGGQFVEEPGGITGADPLFYELARFGSVSFVYVVALPPAPIPWSRYILLMALLGVSLFAALFVRQLVSKHELVEREVELRTDELRQFAYRTSHDLRAPLVRIQALCQVVQEDYACGDTEEVEANLGRIEAQAARLDQLVHDILSLSRADLGDDESEPVSLRALLEEVEGVVNSSFPQHGVRIQLEAEPGVGVRLPPARLLQIVDNLVSNSVKYADHGKEAPFVKVSAGLHAHCLRIQVEDNGLGIPESHQDRIFTMFERFHPEVSHVGSGLGMSIVKKHVEHLRGRIEVKSSKSGTIVVVEVPLSREEKIAC